MEKHSIDLGEPLATCSPLLTVSFLPGLLWSGFWTQEPIKGHVGCGCVPVEHVGSSC